MNYIQTEIDGVWLIEPKVFHDARGYFMEAFKEEEFRAHVGNVHFIQDNESKSSFGVLRGLHYQKGDCSQAKLVRVTKGAVLDIAGDLRKGSPYYCKWVGTELSEENKRMLFLPRGFGHGFVTLTEDVEFCYKVDNFYSKECDRGIRFDDPAIGADFGEVRRELLSAKELASPLLADSDCNFIYEGENA